MQNGRILINHFIVAQAVNNSCVYGGIGFNIRISTIFHYPKEFNCSASVSRLRKPMDYTSTDDHIDFAKFFIYHFFEQFSGLQNHILSKEPLE